MLIDDIIDLLSQDGGNLDEALLKTKVLLHKLGKRDLVGWVNSELNGYTEGDDVPSYRIVTARVLANLVSMTFRAESHPIPLRHLTDDECEKLLRHEIRDPIGILKSQSDKNKLIVPLPMEANGRLGAGLAAGVRINNAWCEINEREVSSIVINVRSRLLDFILDLRDAVGDDTGDEGLKEKSKQVDTSALFQNAIFGANATVVLGGAKSQILVSVQSGNIASLEAALEAAGLPATDFAELKQAIAKDKADGHKSMDGEVGHWFTRLLSKAAKGTVDIGVEVVSSTVAKALTSYLGA